MECRRQTQRSSHDTEHTFIEADKYIKSELEIVIAWLCAIARRIPHTSMYAASLTPSPASTQPN